MDKISRQLLIDASLAIIARGLRARRLRLGYSVAHVAREADISRDTVSTAERGELGNVGTLARHMAVLSSELRSVRVRK